MAEHTGYKGFSRADWERSMRTTFAQHIREVEQAFMRNFSFGALLEAAGRITYGHTGRGVDWPVQYRKHDVEGNTGETTRNFVRKNLYKTAKLDMRGYQATDLMYEREFLENRGEEGVVRVYDEMVDRIETSVKEVLGTQYWIDGNDAANSELWHGMATPFGTPTQTVTYTSGAARTANNADYVYYPNTEYAGLMTTLGNYGGANSSGEYWPSGVADSEYDFWTPLIVNWTSERFAADADDTFATKGEEAMRYGIIHTQRNASQMEQVTNVWLNRDLYRSFLNKQDNRQEIMVEGQYSLRSLGFKNVVYFDGVEVTWETAIPTGIGYGSSLQCVELRSMYDTLLHPEGPIWDVDTQSYRAVVATLSNLKYKSPRNFFQLRPVV